MRYLKKEKVYQFSSPRITKQSIRSSTGGIITNTYIYIYISSSHLAFVRHARVKSIMEAVAFEVDVLRYAVVERVIAEIVAVQLAGQIRVPDVVDLRDACEDVAAGRVRLPGSHRGGRLCDREELKKNKEKKEKSRKESIRLDSKPSLPLPSRVIGRDELASFDDVTMFL